MPAEKFDFRNPQGQQLAALLDRPDTRPRGGAACALFRANLRPQSDAAGCECDVYCRPFRLRGVAAVICRLLPL